jgi:hypothetical protein
LKNEDLELNEVGTRIDPSFLLCESMPYPHSHQYYRSEIRPTGKSYSQSSKRFPFPASYELEDITDAEEDAQTVRATDYKPIPNVTHQDSNSDFFHFDGLEFPEISIRNDQIHLPTNERFKPVKVVEKELKKVDQKVKNQDSKTIGYTILTTLLLFISVHILPLIDWFPVLLRSRMGSHLSSGILFSLCATIGHQFAQSRRYYAAYYRSLSKKKSFQSSKQLFLFVTSVYLTSYTTSWTFMGLYNLYSRVPLLGTMMILFLLFWSSFVFVILSIWYAGKISWTVANTIVKKPVKKPTLHLVA